MNNPWVLRKPQYGWNIFHHHPGESWWDGGEWVPTARSTPHHTCIRCGQIPPKDMLVAYKILTMNKPTPSTVTFSNAKNTVQWYKCGEEDLVLKKRDLP
jgi:hypothetical protein